MQIGFREQIGLFLIMIGSFQMYSQTLHLYGGDDHDVYLGCLNCNQYDSNSIWNEYGTYGNKYGANSIWNEYGTYGNPYSPVSPWNSYSSESPVVVDKNGGFYGYLTSNKYASSRADFELAEFLCEFHELIREDVGLWYEKLFE